MKAALLILCVFGLFGASTGTLKLPQEIVDLLLTVSTTCKEETGVNPEYVNELRRGKLPDDQKGKCYIKCVMMQLQAMKEDGTLDIDLIEASLPDVIKAHGGVETVKKCQHIHEDDLCETAYQLVVCFRKENPELAAMFE